MLVNNSKGFSNSSQRNNEFKMQIGEAVMNSYCMCNVTSFIMAAEYKKLKFPKGKFSQPEDNLCEFICTNKDIDSLYEKNFPAMYKNWKAGKKDACWPNEVHMLLAEGFNKWMGKSIAKFYEAMPLNLFIGHLVNGFTLPTSMTFGPLGHIICVVGFETSADETTLLKYIKGEGKLPSDTKIIFDDPYGYCYNFDKGLYKVETGNDRTMTLSQFIKYSKPLNKETVMCHVLSK